MSSFAQQTLSGFQPLFTPLTMIMTWMVSSVVFIISGVLFVLYSPAQIIIDYTTCTGKSVRPDYVKDDSTDVKLCRLKFTLDRDYNDVLIYYQLNNFYQNHRKYVKSKNDDQLFGTAVSESSLSTCDPLITGKNGKPIYPCGLIANSMFDDQIAFLNDGNSNVTLISTGISWSSDKDRYGKTKYSAADVVPPPNWSYKYKDGLYTDDTIPNLQEYEDLQVWMRVAPFSNFNKLWRRASSLKKGDYVLGVYDHFDIVSFGGQKKVLITTSSVLGDSTNLGYMYVGTGVICLILGVTFLIKHRMHPRYYILI
eukprot:NODE_33_length_36935_cov_1.609241.p13 type:complete len:310 gc:universal NODE_33_length_36935_cov_1.609241:16866-17795(+)